MRARFWALAAAPLPAAACFWIAIDQATLSGSDLWAARGFFILIVTFIEGSIIGYGLTTE